MRRLAIFGAGGHGQVIADAALTNGWEDIVFFDDAWPGLKEAGQWPVVGAFSSATGDAARFEGAIVGIGDNTARLAKMEELAASASFVTVVHPAAWVSSSSRIAPASAIFAGAVVNPFAQLGRACIINTCASVDHHCVLADGVHVSPGAHLGGGVTIGKGSWIGIGAAVRDGVTIGAGVVVGAGAAVVSDVPDGVTVVGVPAKPLAC